MFGFKKKNKKEPEVLTEHEQQERNVIRESSYEDDWMLNIKPVLEGDEEANKEVQKFIEENQGIAPDPSVAANSVKVNPVNDGPLSSIIQGAKKSNEANIAEIIEGSDTHRKMALIEKYRREGGEAPDDIYTDLSKSTFGSEYKNRANSISSTYKPMTIEEQLENRRAMSEQKIDSVKLNVPKPEQQDDIAAVIQKRKELSQRYLEERVPPKETPEEEISSIDKEKETIE
ncbi:hypothetical protein [Spiroplasma endosymbiont of Othius punctulatus]|uniref:hypothetical protein n=1 Tax=Spiroplasma endosymbiont of Othius punctulatus TaxID=3066289 RepID=UPI0030CB82D7